MAPIIETVPTRELVARAAGYKEAGMRFCQCHAQLDGEQGFLVTYTFVDDATNAIENLRVAIAKDEPVPSVSPMFPCAFVFENEMHDLFGIPVTGITIDFQGGFYHVHIPTPMAQVPEAKPRKAAKAGSAEKEA